MSFNVRFCKAQSSSVEGVVSVIHDFNVIAFKLIANQHSAFHIHQDEGTGHTVIAKSGSMYKQPSVERVVWLPRY
ncbi:hypothetical protein GE061_009435 [Apolygus lucorum]|uniref:Uncharacterized protein n=1 Tax=Apolygus lucorum TaxID=248454 RepID=A0A8S9Y070_APOLU|nr:hypothetical protein GE061_009435 [Apolygus lucorum]